MPFGKGLDVIQQAQSGTGKTATFCAGILQRLDYAELECQALVLAPTRELAQQIEKVMRALGDYLEVCPAPPQSVPRPGPCHSAPLPPNSPCLANNITRSAQTRSYCSFAIRLLQLLAPMAVALFPGATWSSEAWQGLVLLSCCR